MKLYKKAFAAAALAAGMVSTTSAQNLFVEENGIVMMEAENVSRPNAWRFRGAASIPSGDPQRLRGFEGRGFIEWRGDFVRPVRIPVSEAQDVINYNFRITRPGVYRLRFRHKQKAGVASDAGNDSFVRFATGSTPRNTFDFSSVFVKIFIFNRPNNYDWRSDVEIDTRNGEGVFVRGGNMARFFAAGDHRLQLAGRSPGHIIDRIALHHSDVDFNDNRFTNLAESRRVSANGGGGGGNSNNFPPLGRRIGLRGTGGFVSHENGRRDMRANRGSVTDTERFVLTDAGRGRVGIRGLNNRFVSSNNGNGDMDCIERRVLSQERFTMVDGGQGRIGFRSSNNMFISGEDGRRDMRCNRSRLGLWEKFRWSRR